MAATFDMLKAILVKDKLSHPKVKEANVLERGNIIRNFLHIKHLLCFVSSILRILSVVFVSLMLN